MRITPKAVIFDYAGVLSLHQSAADWDALVELSGLPEPQFRGLYWQRREPYDRGRVDGSGYWRGLGAAAGLDYGAAQVDALIAADTRSWIHLNPVMVDWLRALQAGGLATAILSNMGVDLRRHVGEHFSWVAQCTHQTFSCDVRAVKPEQAIYRHCLAGLGLTPAQVVFIDDRPINLEAAARLGLSTLLFDDVEGFAKRLEGFDFPCTPL